MALSCLGAEAGEISTRPVAAPSGWIDLCKREPDLCRSDRAAFDLPKLTDAARRQLESVNLEVNRAVVYTTDRAALGVDEFWSLPIAGKGDCEDMALEKRRRLEALGWPRGALLMTVVVAHNGEWHAVLTAATTSGLLVLDNMTDAVLPPERTGHRFHSAQSTTDPDRWYAWPKNAPLIAATPDERGPIAGASD